MVCCSALVHRNNTTIRWNIQLLLWKSTSESKTLSPKQDAYSTRQDSTHSLSCWTSTSQLYRFSTSSLVKTLARTRNLANDPIRGICAEGDLTSHIEETVFSAIFQLSQFIRINILLKMSWYYLFIYLFLMPLLWLAC